jgi:FtsZ-interacting cell division protein ZipA
MFHILGFLFFIVIAIFFIGIILVGSIFSRLFGGKHRSTFYSYKPKDTKQSQTTHDNYQSETLHSTNKHKKIFQKDEGEYVDFEEIKE